MAKKWLNFYVNTAMNIAESGKIQPLRPQILKQFQNLGKVQNFNGRMHTSHLGIFSCSHRFCRCRQNCYLLAIIFQTSEFLLNSAKCQGSCIETLLFFLLKSPKVLPKLGNSWFLEHPNIQSNKVDSKYITSSLLFACD